MTSTLKFNNWQDAAGNAVFDASNGGLPVSGNAIINGDFGIWQRGTSFTPGGGQVYTADRWLATGVDTASRQAFSPGDIEAIGYGNATYFHRLERTTNPGNFPALEQRIEDVSAFSNQDVTISFWARSNVAWNAGTWYVGYFQVFGSGGSSAVGSLTGSGNDFTPTSSWQRITKTISLPSIAGKTIGTNNYLGLFIRNDANSATAGELDIWGVQLEAGPVATPFKPAGGGSKAAELALCQRYFETGDHRIRVVGGGSTTIGYQQQFTVTKRTSPSLSTTPDLGTVVASSANSTSIYISYTSLVSGNGACSYEADAEL